MSQPEYAGADPGTPRETAAMAGTSPPPLVRCAFVVKLRDVRTRSWGNETEVIATSARDAAEQVAGGEQLLDGPGERADLRAKVWKTPYGSVPHLPFYVKAAAHSD